MSVAPAARDAVVVRRAVRAGLVVWAASALILGLVAGQAGGRAAALGVTLGFAAGAVVTAGWLLIAGVLDMLADQHLGRRRMLWTLGSLLVSLVAPILVVGAAGRAGA